MLKTLKAYVGEYKKTAIAAPVFIIFEVIFEMIIPLLMSEIIDNGLGAGNINYVVKVGIIMLLVSFASLFWRPGRRQSRLQDLRKMSGRACTIISRSFLFPILIIFPQQVW